MTQEQQPSSFGIKVKKTTKKVLWITLSTIILGLLIYYFICGITYSEGTRAGVLVKVSKKGYIFKTYEGELNIGGISQGDGTIMPNKTFVFSVYRSDKDVYEKMQQLEGKKIVVSYKQVIKNFFWQGETDYFVNEVRKVE